MKKIHDAFAFKDFDATKILQRPYFRQFGFADESDKMILRTLQDFAVTSTGDVATIEEKNALLKRLLDALIKLHATIKYHADSRLEKYRRTIQAKSDADAVTSKIAREQKLMTFYLTNVAPAINDLTLDVHNIWQLSEQSLQSAYRRRFGERLKQARERAGLSRRELGDALNLSFAGYAYYERGQRDITTTALIRIAQKLKVSTDWLVGLK